MRLLDRYLLRELWIPLGYCGSGFLVFWITADLLSDMADFQRAGLHPVDVALYYAFRLPEFLCTLLPIVLLLSLLYALTQHSRHHELTAIRAAGVGLWRLSAPYFATGLFLSLALFGIQEFAVPPATEHAQAILEGWKNTSDSSNPSQWRENINFINSKDHRRWSAQKYDLSNHILYNVDIEWRRPDGSRRLWIANRAVWTNAHWVLHDVQQHTFAPGESTPLPVTTNRVVLEGFEESPDYIHSQIKLSDLEYARLRKAIRVQLSIRDILEYRRLHPDMEPRNSRLLTTKLHAQIAHPTTCLVVILIALPFGARTGRRDVVVSVAGSIFICFAFFVIQQLALPMGIGGHIPGALAAWLPNLLFAALGLLLIRTMN